MEKQKRKCLSYIEKKQIIELCKNGASPKEIKKQFGISTTTFASIQRNEKEILRMAEDYLLQKKKKKRLADDPSLDNAVHAWILEKKSKGEPISGPLIQEKARILNEKLGGSSDFKASSGWLTGFKQRHGIRLVSMKGQEQLSSNTEDSTKFHHLLRNKIEKEGLLLDNIYNTNKTRLCWKFLPRNTLVSHEEKEAFSQKQNKDRVSILFCANATGTNKLPLVLIGKSQKPRCLKDVVNLPAEYKFQRTGRMDGDVLIDWFKHSFIKNVSTFNNKYNINGKVLLLLNNIPSYPPSHVLNKINDNFEVLYLPPNVTPVIQPMDEGVIFMTKKYYRKVLLRKLLLQDESREVFLKKLNICDCAQLVAAAWSEVKSSTIANIWNPLLIKKESNFDDDSKVHTNWKDSSTNIETRIGVSSSELQEWVEGDVNVDQESENLTDDDYDEDSCEIDQTEQNNKTEDGSTTVEMYRQMQRCYDWLQTREECEMSHLINFKEIIEFLRKKST